MQADVLGHSKGQPSDGGSHMRAVAMAVRGVVVLKARVGVEHPLAWAAIQVVKLVVGEKDPLHKGGGRSGDWNPLASSGSDRPIAEGTEEVHRHGKAPDRGEAQRHCRFGANAKM